MIKVSVLYPYQEGVGFDMDYYLGSHIPMVHAKLGAACKGAANTMKESASTTVLML